MNSQPLISIIIPVYNTAKYLERCLKSVLAQTFKDIEIIIINDGSTDDSKSIIEAYKNLDERIVTIHKDNGGLPSARKAGIAIAKSGYIGFVDSDDWIEPEMYEYLYNIREDNPIDIINSGFIFEYTTSSSLASLENIKLNKLNRDDILGLFPFRKHFMNYENNHVWSKLYRKKIIENYSSIVPDEQNFGEDLLFNIYGLIISKSFYNVSKYFYHYCWNQDSITKSNNAVRLIQNIKLHQNITQLLTRYSYNTKECLEDLTIYMKRNYTGLLLQQEKPYPFSLRGIPRFFNKSIILYGAGRVGLSFYEQLSLYKNINIIDWVDINPDNYNYDFYKIHYPFSNQIAYSNVDYILIAVKKESLANEIRYNLINYGVDPEKLIWEMPN